MAINTRKMRYTADGMAAFRANNLQCQTHTCKLCEDAPVAKSNPENISNRIWSHMEHASRPPQSLKLLGRSIGEYARTSTLASWVNTAMVNYKPETEVLELVKPFSAAFHALLNAERKCSTGLHDLNLVEFTYQLTLEVAAAVLLAADATDDPIELQSEFHPSKAGKDDQFSTWDRLLTGLECDPPIIVMFPFYLMMCKAFTFESTSAQEDYVYSAFTAVDWTQGSNKFTDKVVSFEKNARSAVPTLDDIANGQDRSFWRISQAYLDAVNACENSRPFRAPRRAAIPHEIDHDQVLAMRAFDTIGSAYMCSDGAAWLDDAGADSLIGSALSNDVMDLHNDITTGETRNLLRLLYPDGLSIRQAMMTASTLLSGLLCELYRGHKRARFENREDGRIAPTSAPYSMCRARHRRIFEEMEKYINAYPKFWDWTWEIFQMAKDQTTEAGLREPLVCALKRAEKQEALPSSPATVFYGIYYEMVERTEPLPKRRPLGVSDSLSQVVGDMFRLWHIELREPNKEPGWGSRFDARSDMQFAEVGRILSESGDTDDMYKFAIAYGRLSMGLPYIAYHTIGAIIMAFGLEGQK